MLVLSDFRTRWPTFLLLLLLFLLLLKLAIETSRCIVHSTFSPLVLVNEWKAIEPVLVLVLVVGRRRRRRISDTAVCRQSFGSCQPVRTDIICANQLLYFDILRAQVFQHSPHSPLSSSPPLQLHQILVQLVSPTGIAIIIILLNCPATTAPAAAAAARFH